MANCLVCGASKQAAECHILVLTEAEKAILTHPLDEYTYCKPCWGILCDPVAGPALMSGIAQHHLRDAGVQDADSITARFRSALTNLAIRRS